MAIKFEILGNNLVLTNTETSSVVFDEFAKESSYVSSKLDGGVAQVVYPITGNKNPSTAFGDVIRYSVLLSNAVDSDDTPFTAATFRDFCRNNLGKTSGGSTSLSTYYGEYDNYNALVAAYPAGISGRFAYVLNSQGTQWLPSSLGGTYYGAGWYYDTGSIWANKNDAVFEGLNNAFNKTTDDASDISMANSTHSVQNKIVNIQNETDRNTELIDTKYFETVSKNLNSNPYQINYTNNALTSIVYTVDVGTITKSLNYTDGKLTSIVLSGDTPSGIDLTKTLGYTGDNLTSITYS